ncbi:hypothetical protein AAVH_27760 [Aphelenchoides avenae]|nr:hypothetical protein AAVH_27760 [Aphelenchus avenae]
MDRVKRPKRKHAQPRKLNDDSLKSIFLKYAKRTLYAGSVKFANVIRLSQVSPNPRIRRLVIAIDNMFVSGWTKKMLRHIRMVFPNWNSLRFTMEIQSDDHGYDTYFRNVMNRWSDKFEAYLRQESHPLAIEVEASLDHVAADDRIRARHYPKFVCTVVHGDFEEHGVGTKFLFIRTEDFGEERSLNMKCAIYVDGDEEQGEEDEQREEHLAKGLGRSRY